MMNPQRVNAPFDPPECLNVVEALQTFSFTLGVPMGSTATTFTVASLMAGVPGSTTFWQEVRFEKFILYGAEVGIDGADKFRPLQANVGSSTQGGTLSIRDDGTDGSKRAAVGFRLGLLGRAQWRNPAATDVLFSVNQDSATSMSIRCIATIALKSPNTNTGV